MSSAWSTATSSAATEHGTGQLLQSGEENEDGWQEIYASARRLAANRRAFEAGRCARQHLLFKAACKKEKSIAQRLETNGRLTYKSPRSPSAMRIKALNVEPLRDFRRVCAPEVTPERSQAPEGFRAMEYLNALDVKVPAGGLVDKKSAAAPAHVADKSDESSAAPAVDLVPLPRFMK